MLRVLLLSPPGAGKGTQGELLADQFRIPHLATGDLLRDNVAKGTELGKAAKSYMDAGGLVTDDLVIDMILARLGTEDPEPGFLLDGFPRTLSQAKAAYAWGVEMQRTFHAVLLLEVPQDELVRRLIERGIEKGRTDDTEEVIRHRLDVYRTNTEPLIDFYRGRDILERVDGVGTVEEVNARCNAALASHVI